MENCSEINISFLHACLFGNDNSLKDYSKKNNFQFCIDFESNKYMVRILFSKNFDVLIISVTV